MKWALVENTGGRLRERFIEKIRKKNRQMSVLPLHLPTYSKNRHFSFFSPYMSQDASKFLPIVGLFQLHPSDKQSHFKVNDCTEQKTLSIHLELIQ